ncbi:hypothetical protein [Kitasatospora purpeofusca]|uniref:hypothetical protein n=1 Tax=Kitasatospora purpeofusca TaxID=67352 RepID=UPI0004BF8113|nr:hypothetical protein [Kitasatospora purpeofusca]
MSIVITDLPRFIGQLAPHISPDTTLPPLTGIHLEVTGTQLVGAATDRYTVAITRRDVEENAEPATWSALLDSADLRALRALVPARTAAAGVRLAYEAPTEQDPDGGLAFTHQGRTLRLSANLRRDARFPRWRQILSTALEGEPRLTEPAAFDPLYLARWAKAAERHTPVTLWSSGPDKPLVVAVGGDFVGLQMPVRIDMRHGGWAQWGGRSAVRAAWAPLLAPAEESVPTGLRAA